MVGATQLGAHTAIIFKRKQIPAIVIVFMHDPGAGDNCISVNRKIAKPAHENIHRLRERAFLLLCASLLFDPYYNRDPIFCNRVHDKPDRRSKLTFFLPACQFRVQPGDSLPIMAVRHCCAVFPLPVVQQIQTDTHAVVAKLSLISDFGCSISDLTIGDN